MEVLKAAGLVLASRDFGESDRILDLYTREQGRIRAIAKGANRSRRRFVNKLEPFTQLVLRLRPGRGQGLVLLTGADLVAARMALRQDLARYAAASMMVEFPLRHTMEGEPDPPLFALLRHSLDRLETGDAPGWCLVLFMLRFAVLSGFRPEFGCCVSCGGAIAGSGPFGFDHNMGGALCPACLDRGGAALRGLGAECVRLLARAADLADPEALHRLRASPGAARQSLDLLRRFLRHLLGRDMQGWDLVRPGGEQAPPAARSRTGSGPCMPHARQGRVGTCPAGSPSGPPDPRPFCGP